MGWTGERRKGFAGGCCLGLGGCQPDQKTISITGRVECGKEAEPPAVFFVYERTRRAVAAIASSCTRLEYENSQHAERERDTDAVLNKRQITHNKQTDKQTKRSCGHTSGTGQKRVACTRRAVCWFAWQAGLAGGVGGCYGTRELRTGGQASVYVQYGKYGKECC